MELLAHVIKAIRDYDEGDLEPALMHACFAIEASARNFFGGDIGKQKYKEYIDKHLWIIEPMMGSGVNLHDTVWHNVAVDNGHGKIITDPNFSDIVYHIFRCNHAHAALVSKNYELLAPKDGKLYWQVGKGLIRMPTLVVPALVVASVLAKVNRNISTSGDYSFHLATERFTVKAWWGREDDFRLFLSQRIPNRTRVKLDGLEHFSPTTLGQYFSVEITPPTLA